MNCLYRAIAILATAFILVAGNSITQAERSQDDFFCMNGITPFHARANGLPDEVVFDRLRADLDRVRQSGATSVRIDMWWSYIEPEAGDFAWDFPDRVINEIVEAGLEPYPILCYNAAWNPDVSPAVPVYREQFGNYVFELVQRYKDRVEKWEVWNEPNTPPFWVPEGNPKDYAELLKVAYRRAKEADPHCMVVAMCTAGADYDFIERAYRAGARGHLDAVSYHHYNSEKTEVHLEQEIRTIRGIMRRYGDEDKPLLITEIGLSTGASLVVSESTTDEQAEWVAKKLLVAVAEGIDRFYYFKLADDPPELDPDGLWGLLDSDFNPKPSWHVYTTMTDRLKGATFLGKASRLATAPTRRDDVEFQVYTKDTESFAIAWVRENGDPLTISIPASGEVVVEDLAGGTLNTLQPDEKGYVSLELNAMPVYLRDLGAEGLALVAVRFDPPVLEISPGETLDVEMTVNNPLGNPLTVRLDPFFWPIKGRDVSVAPRERAVTLAPGKEVAVVLEFSLPADAEPFEEFSYAFSDNGVYTYALPVRFRPPLDIDIRGKSENSSLVLETRITNRQSSPVSGDIVWKEKGGTVFYREELETLRPGDSRSFDKIVTPQPGETIFEVVCTADDGIETSEAYRVHGQPIGQQSFRVDGVLDDWAGVPWLQLAPAAGQIRDGRRVLTEDEFGADFWAAWTPEALYVAAEVVDSTPMMNRHERSEIWRGDSLEIYLGFDGPSVEEAYGPRQFQIGLSPGGEGTVASAWNWRGEPEPGSNDPTSGRPIQGARVAAVRTGTGYRLEASIPLSEFDASAENGELIGFEVHVNNLSNPDSQAPDAVIIWNGGAMDWRDPSGWGAAQVMSIAGGN